MKIFFVEWNASYEKLMVNNLKNEFNVQDLNNVMKHFTKKNITLKKLGIGNGIFVRIHQLLKFNKINEDDLLICNGFSVLGFIDLLKNLKCKKTLIIRDTLFYLEREMRFKKKWLGCDEDFIQKVQPHFDYIYSFDPNDCNRFNLKYLHQFVPFTLSDLIKYNIKNTKNNKCYFLGAYREDRELILRELYTRLENHDQTIDFFLLDKYNKASNYPEFCNNIQLSYEENIAKVIDSDIIIEINHKEQSGLTLRAIEALAFNKKLITNNKNILNYNFYSSDKIFIIDHDDYKELGNFIKRHVESGLSNEVRLYTADHMLKIVTDNYR